VARNAVEIWEGVVALDPIGRSSEVMLSWACSSEDKKESWEEKDCERGEEEENIGVPPIASE